MDEPWLRIDAEMEEKRRNRAVQSTLVDGTHECRTGRNPGQLFFAKN
jgi:hypothetical protein